MSEPTNPTMRKQPRQARSQQRVDTILTAAAELFEDIGYEAATTNAIAARAGVAIGSLYQFFPNKEAIIEAMAQRHAEEIRGMLVYDPGSPITNAIDHFVDNLVTFKMQYRGFHPLLMGVTSLDEEIIECVRQLLTYYFPVLQTDQLKQSSAVMVALVKGIMSLLMPTDKFSPEQVKLELKTAMRGYLRALLVRSEHPLPLELE